ncbi:MAG: sulfite exporter TauE/SafE family protein [Bacteroidales bacterium]|nr:sulfite exporter TauE/SafE family protein [Bacteroidales bacterium]
METLNIVDIYTPLIVAILIVAGFMVGFINTLAGSGTVITYSVFMALGLPASYANGTIRVGVIMQTLSASLMFKKNSVLEIKQGLILGVPIVIGSILGAQVAVEIEKQIFEYIVGAVMLLMIVLLFVKPDKWIAGKAESSKRKNPWVQFLIYLSIGFYGGFIHIGVGIFLIAALVLFSGYDLLRANALKVFTVLLYSPFALFVYMYNDHIHYGMALISSIGNVFGGIVASKIAIKKGSRFIHWFLIVVVVLFTAKTFGLLDFILPK